MKMSGFLLFSLAILSVTAAAFASGGHEERFSFGHPGQARQVDRVIPVKAGDIFFDPKSVTVRAGETVKFVVTNTGKLVHEFVLGDQAEQAEHEREMRAMASMPMQGMDMGNGHGMPMSGMQGMHHDPNGIRIEPGQTVSLIWTFTRPGRVEYGCHEPGHFAAGMVGKITVTR